MKDHSRDISRVSGKEGMPGAVRRSPIISVPGMDIDESVAPSDMEASGDSSYINHEGPAEFHGA